MANKKIKLLAAVLAGLGMSTGYAQQAATASGGDASGGGGSVSYSVGQVSYTALSGTSGSSNQGVQQPYEFFTTGIDDNKSISIKASMYPNPVQSNVNLLIEDMELQKLSYRLTTADNKLLQSAKIYTQLTQVPMDFLKPGTYYLSVINDKNILKTFTIIKNH